MLLLTRGRAALDELFPASSDEMIAAGGDPGDSQGDSGVLDGYPLRPDEVRAHRNRPEPPAVEHLIRARVAALPGIDIIDSTEVSGSSPTITARHRCAGPRAHTWLADPAIAATSSWTPPGVVRERGGWIEDLGYPTP